MPAPLSWNEIKSRVLNFSRRWADAANEDSEAKPFWIEFFDCFGITNKRVFTFELNVKKHGGGAGFVDLFWPGMLLVEQKSRGKDLDKAYAQATDYLAGISERDLPQIIIVSDFARFRVYDLTDCQPGRYTEFALADLHKHVRLFGFIAGYKPQRIEPQNPVNIKAAERMGELHDALKSAGYAGHPLEVLLVRLLFCLFADDTAIFQPAQAFRAFIEERTSEDGSDLGPRLAQLFQVLDTPEGQRSKNLDGQLAAFPYVNGRLFAESLPIADFDADTRAALLKACALDWSAISPAIFGSLFQSIMDEKARRHLGAHYTSEENILKLIRPLFLDELRAEFEKVKRQRNKLFEFHKKLRTLSFFDPACGCGNFLVISYRELRLLELDVLRAAAALTGHAGQQSVDVHQLIGVNVDQFYGIEIEEFPAQIAQVAMWLMDHQMNLRAGEEFGLYFARIPLVASPRIVHGNALTLNWDDVLPASRCSYVLGNPPFLGKKEQSVAQKTDFAAVMGKIKGFGVLDFVAAWYVKATQYAQSARQLQNELQQGFSNQSQMCCAFVSTNSITQGEQVGVLWGWLLAQGVHIHFAHRTFKWSNEARGKAAVHCVIIGFGLQDRVGKTIYEYADIKGQAQAVPVANINPYLVDAPDILIDSRRTAIGDVPEIVYGSFALDDGNFTLDDQTRTALINADDRIVEYIRPFLGGEELLHGTRRWCLWLRAANPSNLRKIPLILERINAVRDWRSSRDRATTRKLAATPTLFAEIRQPFSDYIAIPTVSSERRNFIPMALLSAEVIASNQLYVVAGATLFHFGILSSTMHNAWVRAVCGRLESRYRYSAAIVYNNFPWPFPSANTEEKEKTPAAQTQKAQAAIESAAQAVLDARAAHPGSSLADLYDPLTMPADLLKAHQRLDAAVDKAYQLAGGPKTYAGDAERVAFLFSLYQRQTGLLAAAPAPRRRRGAASS